MATRAEPGKFDCYAKLAEDEPYFLIRAKDPVAEHLTAAWAALRAGDLASAVRLMCDADAAWRASGRTMLPYDSEKSVEAQQCAKAMRSWRLAKELARIEASLEVKP